MPIPVNSNSANPQPGGSETFQKDSLLEDNNQFIAEANELLKHYDKHVIREREKFIKELEGKSRTKRRNEKARPTAHSSFQKEFGNDEKSKRENMEEREEKKRPPEF